MLKTQFHKQRRIGLCGHQNKTKLHFYSQFIHNKLILKTRKKVITIQYLGGKSRISTKISEVINNEISRWKEQDSVSDRSGNREREREREREATPL